MIRINSDRNWKHFIIIPKLLKEPYRSSIVRSSAPVKSRQDKDINFVTILNKDEPPAETLRVQGSELSKTGPTGNETVRNQNILIGFMVVIKKAPLFSFVRCLSVS